MPSAARKASAWNSAWAAVADHRHHARVGACEYAAASAEVAAVRSAVRIVISASNVG